MFLALSLAVAGCSEGGAAAEQRPDAAGQLVSLPDGRHINLRCAGRGSPTVILEAGYGANASAWGRVQPALSRSTRVCAYDRAGYGFSDPGPLPRDGAAAARDLDQALEQAGVEGPYIVVGHSAGGLYGRLFAARRPGEVAGLVLLDPTVEQVVPTPGSGDGLDGIRRRVRRCLENAQAQPPPALSDAAWSGCVGRAPSEHDWAVALRPETWRNQLSELDSMFGRTSMDTMRLGDLLRAVPLYVITASDTANASTTVGYGDHPQSVWELQHVRLAATSERGFQRTVLSSHLVMIDRPEVVVEAVLAMVRAARAQAPPEPLPPSEAAGAPGFTSEPPPTK
jgi:pimeloyl-ACP methyl ester carboxylesterase